MNKSVTLESGNTNITGVCTATTFSGSGASLTNLPAGNLTGVLPAISGANLTSLPSQVTISNNADNRVITGGSGTNLNGESLLTFDGNKLLVASDSYNILELRADENNDGGNDDTIIQFTHDGTLRAEIRYDESSSRLELSTADNRNDLVIDSSGNVEISDGNLILANGHGIDFSATSDHGSATPASELLDDYEEGSWTPVLESTSTNPTVSSYSKQQGLYTKIGNVVHLFCFMDISAGNIGGTLTGDGIITGLPYVISNNPSSTDMHGSACDNLKSIPNTFSAQRNNAMLYFPPGQNYLAIHQYNTTNPIYQTGWGMSQIGNGNRFKWAWTGQYRTDQI